MSQMVATDLVAELLNWSYQLCAVFLTKASHDTVNELSDGGSIIETAPKENAWESRLRQEA